MLTQRTTVSGDKTDLDEIRIKQNINRGVEVETVGENSGYVARPPLVSP